MSVKNPATRKKPVEKPAIDLTKNAFGASITPTGAKKKQPAVKPTSGIDKDTDPVVQSKSGPIGAMISTLNKEPTMEKQTAQEIAEASAKAKIAAKAAKLAAAEAKKAEALKAKEEKVAAAAAKKAAAAAEKAAAAEARAAAAAERKAAKAETNEPAEGMSSALREKVTLGLYVKGKNGQLRTNDSIALALESVAVNDMVPLIMKTMGLTENPYGHLNQGQQSMNLRNRLRGAIRKEAKIEGTETVISLERLTSIRDADFQPYAAPVKTTKAPEPETAEA